MNLQAVDESAGIAAVARDGCVTAVGEAARVALYG